VPVTREPAAFCPGTFGVDLAAGELPGSGAEGAPVAAGADGAVGPPELESHPARSTIKSAAAPTANMGERSRMQGLLGLSMNSISSHAMLILVNTSRR
jgi:hypothetical protein